MSSDETLLENATHIETVEICCQCGRQMTLERSSEHVLCECGASYAITITQLKTPDGAERK